jgi:hypothetical protein
MILVCIVGEAVMVEVVGRSVETILEDWRAVERRLPNASEAERPVLEARIAALCEEHRCAIAARQVEAAELGGTAVPSMPTEALSARR